MSDTMKLALTFTAIDAASSVVRSLSRHVRGLSTDAAKVRKDFDSMVSHFQAGLKGIAASRYLYNQLKPGVQAAADLEEAMLKVKMAIGSGAKESKQLNDELAKIKSTAMVVATNVPYTATQVADIQNELLRAGMKVQDVQGERGAGWATAALSAIGEMAPEAAAVSMGKVTAQYSLSGGQFKEMADWMSKADVAGSVTIPGLFYGLEMAGSAAASLHISLKDTITALTILSPLGQMAGTDLNRLLENTSGKGKKAAKDIASLGLRFFDKKGRFLGEENMFNEIQDKFGKIQSDKDKLLKFHHIFGEEGGRAAKEIVRLWEKDKMRFRDYNRQIESGLALEEKTGIRKEGLKAAFKDLTTTATTTFGELFQPALAPLREGANLLNDWIGKVGQLAQTKPEIAKWSSGIGAGLVGGAATYGAVRLARGALKGVKGFIGNIDKTAAGVTEGAVWRKAAGVTPVFVVNMPGDFGGSTAAPAAAASLGIAGVATIAAAAAAMLGLAYVTKDQPAFTPEDPYASTDWLYKKIRAAVERPLALKPDSELAANRLRDFISGPLLQRPRLDLTGLQPGASRFFPSQNPEDPWAMMDLLGDKVATAMRNTEIHPEITLNIKVDQAGRAMTSSSDPNVKTTINLQRGEFSTG
jgi:TP901 family phage tail tape measure protein